MTLARESQAAKVGTHKINDIQSCIEIPLNFILRYSDREELLQLKGDVCQVEIIHLAVLPQIRFHCEGADVSFGGCTNDSDDLRTNISPGRLTGCLLKSGQIEEGGCKSLTGDGISVKSWVE